jgi:putative PIN family toxin of toxin-antitoxin system
VTDRRRVILDTNILISAFLFPSSAPAAALTMARKTCILLASPETLAELLEVLRRDKFNRYLPLADRIDIFRVLLEEMETVEVITTMQACRDPRDDKFLSLAVDASASALVTGDDDLLALHPFGTLSILTPAQFVSR